MWVGSWLVISLFGRIRLLRLFVSAAIYIYVFCIRFLSHCNLHSMSLDEEKAEK